MGFRAGIEQISHLPRYKEVANTLVKHGFGFMFDRFAWRRMRRQKGPDNVIEPELSAGHIAARLRLVLEELGPTFIKLGQILSTRPDLLPPGFIEQLEKLQDEVPPFSHEVLLNICQGEGLDVEHDLAYYNPEPLAAASIAQVHEALLPTGQKVVLKVKRPGIDKSVDMDLQILMEFSVMLEKRNSWAKLYKISEIVDELGRALRNELDFRREARNADIFYMNFKDDEHVIIPRVIWEYSSERILVLEYVEGIKISDFIGLKQAGYKSETIAERLVDALFKQIFEYGFMHADPHPGNIAIADGEKIIFYDFGQVGTIDDITRERAIKLLINMMRYDTNGVSRVLLEIGIGSQYVNQEEFKRDVSRLQQKYYGLPLSQIKVGEALAELVELSVKHQLRLPAELSLMVKMLMTVENVISQLDPQLSIVDIAQPYGKKLFLKKLAPGQVKREITDLLYDYFQLLRSLPREVDHVLRILEGGEIKIKMEHTNLRGLMERIDVMSNRLSVAIILASIIVGSSLVVGKISSSFLANIPMVEIGFSIAMILGLFMVYSILRSGRY